MGQSKENKGSSNTIHTQKHLISSASLVMGIEESKDVFSLAAKLKLACLFSTRLLSVIASYVLLKYPEEKVTSRKC